MSFVALHSTKFRDILCGVWLGVFFCLSNYVQAVDVIKVNIGASVDDHRIHFKGEVLTRALERTKEEYGDYKIEVTKNYMNTNRSFKKLAAGKIINVTYALTRRNLEEVAEPIRIPVRKGLISYRLLVIHEDSLTAFEKVETLEDLKALTVGLDNGWATYNIMKHANFKVIDVADYGSMFDMLSFKRFDFLPRGVNEVFAEVESHNAKGRNLVIEPTLALKIPSATYIFVSKKAPRIKERLSRGLLAISGNGELDEIFEKYFANSLDRAMLDKRKIIEIENPSLPEKTPVDKSSLWLDVDSYYLK